MNYLVLYGNYTELYMNYMVSYMNYLELYSLHELPGTVHESDWSSIVFSAVKLNKKGQFK